MQRIIISISELSKAHWTLIYRFINGLYENTLEEKIFVELQGKAKALTITKNSLDEDAYYAYGEKLYFKTLPTSGITTFSIIYIKEDDKEDFSDLVPFFLLKQKFKSHISLGIDVGNISLDKNKQGVYTFKCSDFLRFIEDKKPQFGQRSIYFINTKTIDKSTGEIKNYSSDNVTSLAGKGRFTDNDNSKNENVTNASRRYLPLIKINEEKFSEFFGEISHKTEEARYITESISKLTNELKKKKYAFNTEKYYSIFEEWLIKAYFYSLGLPFDKIGKTKYEGIHNVLHSYCNNIYELVQNIIFHGGKNGLVYFVFNRKDSISENQKNNIPYFEEYNKEDRFIEIGIFDYGEKGIIDKYLSEASLFEMAAPDKYGDWVQELKAINIKSFFDLNSILTTGVNRPQLRYAANLGLKSFANSVLKHRGYFSIESNVNSEKHWIESIIQEDLNGKKVLNFGDVKKVESVNGTHYEIILPVKGEKTIYSTVTQTRPQHIKLNDLLRNPPHVISEFCFKDIINNDFSWISLSKDQQKHNIADIGEKLITLVKEKTTDKTIAIKRRQQACICS